MRTIDFLNEIRAWELRESLRRAGIDVCGLRVLEIGSGTGYQLALLRGLGAEASGIDLASSNYRADRVAEVIEYDGANIPFAAGEFDLIFSSNTLEHIAELDAFESEMRRVLKPEGQCLHILPRHTWRLWTTLARFPWLVARAAGLIRPGQGEQGADAPAPSAQSPSLSQSPYPPPSSPPPCGLPMRILNKLVPPRHGERGSRISEYFYFKSKWWQRHFMESGWRVEKSFEVGLFYTGNMLLAQRLSLKHRAALARMLGSACQGYVVRRLRDDL